MTGFPGPQAASWWQELQPKDEAGKRHGGDRGALARLRRCSIVMDAMSEPATLKLCRRLGAGEDRLERAGLVAAVLAHVRDDQPGIIVARQIGVQQDGSAVMSDLRFRRLLQAETTDEQLIGFRRLVALAGRRVNVADLAAGLWHWGHERTRRHWIYAYHDAPDLQAGTDSITQANEDAIP